VYYWERGIVESEGDPTTKTYLVLVGANSEYTIEEERQVSWRGKKRPSETLKYLDLNASGNDPDKRLAGR